MPFIDFLRNGHAGGQQGNKSISVHFNVAIFPKILHRHADAGLGKLQLVGNINGPDRPLPLFQHQDRLQIVLCGFLDLQCAMLLSNALSHMLLYFGYFNTISPLAQHFFLPIFPLRPLSAPRFGPFLSLTHPLSFHLILHKSLFPRQRDTIIANRCKFTKLKMVHINFCLVSPMRKFLTRLSILPFLAAVFPS